MTVKQSDIYLHTTCYYRDYLAFVTKLEIFENRRGRNLKDADIFLSVFHVENCVSERYIA